MTDSSSDEEKYKSPSPRRSPRVLAKFKHKLANKKLQYTIFFRIVCMSLITRKPKKKISDNLLFLDLGSFFSPFLSRANRTRKDK